MVTNNFTSIRLDEMEQVQLMNRTDRKYWFHASQLAEILEQVQNDYRILEIKGERELEYTSTYFDTMQNTMFTAHHNGKLNRYKIRKRSYVSSGISFLEVKFKNNKGRTIKERMPSKFGNTAFTAQEIDFINTTTPFQYIELQQALVNQFKRLTLVNKNFKERCTIDLHLGFEHGIRSVELDDLVIVEIKADGNSGNSPLALALREGRVKSSGMSKYCVGRTLLDPDVKKNTFKPKIRSLEKTMQTTTSLYQYL